MKIIAADISSVLDDYLDAPYEVHFDRLMEIEKTVSDWTSFLLGALAIWISAFLMVITSCDIAYITIPAFQETVRRKHWDGAENAKFRCISHDARDAVTESSLTNGETSALAIYLKKRIKTYIICSIMLGVCVLGTDLVVDIAVKIVSGILKGFGGL